MANSSDPAEAVMMCEAIVRGFYGGELKASGSLA
jgi:hypothetical protein